MMMTFLLALSVPFSDNCFSASSAPCSLASFNCCQSPVHRDHNTAAAFSRLRGEPVLINSSKTGIGSP
ncbi:hypothetical protein I3842_Q136500 [Carya illinoinensis]|uniref:Secreted protein n=1 Tax=Carya illinoinensis TaxID=32201 RepID=A0A922D254_CARIL|nr:hypothetical protein I3842_Q136500 [Carya illinoinensis]